MLSSRLKHLRKINNKTQKQVADFIGITRPAFTAYEIGKREPDNKILQKIADYFEVTTDYLLGRSNEPELTEIEDKERDSEVERLLKIIESLPEDKRKKIEEDISKYGQYLIDKEQEGKN